MSNNDTLGMREERLHWKQEREPRSSEDWAEVHEIEKDILLLYHELLGYDNIMGDHDYANVFKLPYWDFLNPTGLDQDWHRLAFMQEGCLVMILAMAWDLLDGSGTHLDSFHETVPARLAGCNAASDRAERLLVHVRDAVTKALAGDDDHDELYAESAWVRDTIVRGYFESMISAGRPPSAG